MRSTKKTAAKTTETSVNNDELFEALDLIEKTKGIPADVMIDKLRTALEAAYRKEYGTDCLVKVDINKDRRTVRVYGLKEVVEEVTNPRNQISLADAQKKSARYQIGSMYECDPVNTMKLGRLSAQSAKQIIIQSIRTAENQNRTVEYEKRKEEVIYAVVTTRDDATGDVEVDTGTSVLSLPASEQIPGEKLSVGDRIRVFVSEVAQSADNGPVVTISRKHQDMIKRMLEADIPEINDGTVLVKSVAREAGSRTKVAVYSRDPEVDAVGACIGNRGMRINNIVEELHGEKIDVVNYSEKPEEYIAASLSPATVIDVEFDGTRSAKATVSSDQLSLAIGKEGQNVRLAAKLTGYKIDIKGVVA